MHKKIYVSPELEFIRLTLANVLSGSPENPAIVIDDNGLDIMDATRIQRFLAFYEVPYPIGDPVAKSKD